MQVVHFVNSVVGRGFVGSTKQKLYIAGVPARIILGPVEQGRVSIEMEMPLDGLPFEQGMAHEAAQMLIHTYQTSAELFQFSFDIEPRRRALRWHAILHLVFEPADHKGTNVGVEIHRSRWRVPRVGESVFDWDVPAHAGTPSITIIGEWASQFDLNGDP